MGLIRGKGQEGDRVGQRLASPWPLRPRSLDQLCFQPQSSQVVQCKRGLDIWVDLGLGARVPTSGAVLALGPQREASHVVNARLLSLVLSLSADSVLGISHGKWR